jgi:GntR family transcriptional regulator / MocR family aminotransferase
MAKRPNAFTPVISIDRKSREPLRLQIYRELRHAIASGILQGGQRVPSSRMLSIELNVSRIPVLAAYAQLLSEGYIETRKGSGTFITAALPETLMHCHRPADGSVRRASGTRQIARRAALFPPEIRGPWYRGLGAFGVHQPAFEEFPFAVWSRLITHHSKGPSARAIHSIHPMGSMRFREELCNYLRTSRGVRAEPDQVMIVSGSQQALQISANVLLDPGAAVWMEEPGYRLARNVFVAAGCRLIPVPVDDEGLNVTAGIKRCANASVAYVTPSHQYPLGSTMSARRRMELLNWAEGQNAWIIEDDYDSEYRFETPPVASLQGLDTNERVIYIGTFSKVLFASLRIGYIVIPPDLVDRFISVRYAMDIFPPYLFQEVIADFIHQGHFARHIRRMRHLYAERRNALADLMTRTCGNSLEIHGAAAGMHLAAVFPVKRDDVAMAEEAAKQGLWLWPLSRSYITKNVRTGFILGYGNVATHAMPRAVGKLRSALNRRLM